MKEEFAFSPKVLIPLLVLVMAISVAVAAWLHVECDATDAEMMGWSILVFGALLVGYLYLVRFEIRRLTVDRGIFKFESFGSSPGKGKSFRLSELRIIERGADVLQVMSRGNNVAVLRRAATTEYLWSQLRERFGLDGTSGASSSGDVMVAAYEFTPVRVRHVMTNGLIYWSVIVTALALVFHVDLFRALSLIAGMILPIGLIAYAISRKDLVKLVVSMNEVIVEPLGMLAVIPGRQQRFPREAVGREVHPDRVVIRSDGSIVGIIRKSSTTKEKWEELLNDVTEHTAVMPARV